MFDFAQSLDQNRKPTKRLFASAVVSCILHILLLIVIIENPWLLKGGVFKNFRGIILTQDASTLIIDDGIEDYRTITVLRPMTAPSPETLNKYIYNWDNEAAPKEEASIPVRWGDENEAAPDEEIQMTALNGAKPKPTPAGIDDAEDLAGTRDNTPPEFENTPPPITSITAGDSPEPSPEKETGATLSDSGTQAEIALNIAPDMIPDAISKPESKNSPENSSAPDNINIFENEQQAIDHQGSGIFDAPEGFPLGDYAYRIKKRVTGSWYIPSNLRDSKGHTTVVFFIDRSGQHFGTRIVESSGNNSLNMTALNAIISSNPFPPLPQGFPGDHIGVKYVFIRDPQ